MVPPVAMANGVHGASISSAEEALALEERVLVQGAGTKVSDGRGLALEVGKGKCGHSSAEEALAFGERMLAQGAGTKVSEGRGLAFGVGNFGHSCARDKGASAGVRAEQGGRWAQGVQKCGHGSAREALALKERVLAQG